MNDITLNGVAYTVVPGSYRKRSATTPAGPRPRETRRLELGPFAAGQRQAVAAGARHGWDSAGVGPCFDGQGGEPFPASTAFADALLDLPGSAARAHGVIAGNTAYIGLGRRIYTSVALDNATWSALSVAADLGAGFTISGLAYYQDDLLVMLSSGQDIRKLNTASNTLTIWRSGEKGVIGCGYAGQLLYAPRQPNAQEDCASPAPGGTATPSPTPATSTAPSSTWPSSTARSPSPPAPASTSWVGSPIRARRTIPP